MVAAFVFPSWQVKETSGMSLLSGPSRVLVIFVGVIEDPKPIQRGGRQGRGAEEWRMARACPGRGPGHTLYFQEIPRN